MESFITLSVLEHFIKTEPKIPRDRYVDYFKDLYALYGSNISESTFIEGGQLTYSEIGIKLLSQLKKANDLVGYDALVAANWSYEFDPDHASCLPYFLDEYQLNCNIFDFSGVGTLSPLNALKLIFQIQKKNKSKKAILLALEQTTVPRNKLDYDLIPTIDGGVLLAIEASSSVIKNSLKLVMMDFLRAQYFNERGFIITEYINALKKSYSIDRQNTRLFFAKSSAIYKRFKYESCQGDSIKNNDIGFFDSRPGILPFMEQIHRLLISKENKQQYSIIFIEDHESNDVGCLLLEKV